MLGRRNATQAGYRTDMSVKEWLDSWELGSLTEAFIAAGYTDFMVIQVRIMSLLYILSRAYTDFLHIFT